MIFLAYLFYFVAATVSPLQRRWLAKKRDFGGIEQISFAFKVSCVVVGLSLLIPIFSPFELRGDISQIILLAFASGVCGALFLVSSYIAQKHIEAGITTLISNIYTPVTIAFAWIFLGEKLTESQIIGTFLLLLTILFISKKHRIKKFRFDKNFLLMIASGVFLGVTLVAERALIKITGFTAGTLISWWFQCLFVGLAVLFTKSKSSYTYKEVTITGVLRFFQMLSWVILLVTVGNLSVVSAVTTFKIVVIFIAAALFLKEREDIPRKILGSIIAVIGLYLMK